MRFGNCLRHWRRRRKRSYSYHQLRLQSMGNNTLLYIAREFTRKRKLKDLKLNQNQFQNRTREQSRLDCRLTRRSTDPCVASIGHRSLVIQSQKHHSEQSIGRLTASIQCLCCSLFCACRSTGLCTVIDRFVFCSALVHGRSTNPLSSTMMCLCLLVHVVEFQISILSSPMS